jgi:hypothetical protein
LGAEGNGVGKSSLAKTMGSRKNSKINSGYGMGAEGDRRLSVDGSRKNWGRDWVIDRSKCREFQPKGEARRTQIGMGEAERARMGA